MRERIETVRRGDELEALRTAWEQLWLEDPCSTPFQSPAWLLPWWRQFGQADLRVLTWWLGDRLIGLLPLYVLPVEPDRGKLLLLGAGTSDYLNGVFAPGFQTASLREGLRMLSQEGGWTHLDVTQVRPESLLRHALAGVSGGENIGSDPCSTMRAVTVEQLPAKIRRNFMYYRNRASREHELRYSLADEADWPEVWKALVRLHTERWKASGEPGVLADSKVLAMHHEAVPAMLACGILRLGCLRFEEEIIAAMYGFADPQGRGDRKQYLYLPGISLAHADLRPGTLLLGFTIDAAAREGVALVDMLRGDEGYKQIWHVEPFPTIGFSMCREAFVGTS